ncbi:MAG: MFS transporter [Chloroflexota bacterium]
MFTNEIIIGLAGQMDQPYAHPRLTEGGWTGQAAWPARVAWVLYDFANTIFSMNVATLYFAVWLVTDLGASNTSVAIGNGLASLLIAVAIPPLAAISDGQHRRVSWVIGFTVASCIATALIGVLGQTLFPPYSTTTTTLQRPFGYHVPVIGLTAVLAAYVVANFAYQAALPFYNAMLTELASPARRGRLSGIGTAVGYVGTIVGLLLVAPFVAGTLPLVGALPARIIDSLRLIPFSGSGGRVSTFVPTALLFLFFSIPLAVFCREGRSSGARSVVPWRSTFSDISTLLRKARGYPGALRFILASFVYQDAIGTIISFMALYAVQAMGFESGSEQTLFLVLTVPAILGSYIFGQIVDRVGPKRTLVGVISAWVVLLVGLVIAPSRSAFWVIGALIGLIFGGVGTAERPLLLTLIPEAEAGRFFSLMLLSARAAAVFGPVIWGVTVDGLIPSYGKGLAYRAAVSTTVVAMFIALCLLWNLPDHWSTSFKARKHSRHA